MPMYEYECPKCGLGVTKKRAIAERDDPVRCPACWGTMTRTLSRSTSFALKGGGWYSDGYSKKP